MKAIFEAIAYLFEEILFIPLNMLRELELTSWVFANAFNWLFLLIGFLPKRKISKCSHLLRGPKTLIQQN